MSLKKSIRSSLLLIVCSLPIACQAEKLWSDGNSDVDYFKHAQELNKIYTTLAEKLSPAVVNIFTKSQVQSSPMMQQHDLFQFFFGHPGMPPQMRPRQREAQSLGSGFVINEEGLIVTNSHVVRIRDRNADQVSVKFLGEPETSSGHPAEILGVDPSTDVAVLRLKDKSKVRAVAPLGDSSELKVGEWILAIGNPFGHTHTVTQGIVSALGRSSAGLDIRSEFIQTDASINPGNSGGPLFNLKGEVVGINTAIDARGPGIGFAIPINTAKNVIQQLVEKGSVTRGWIGIVGSNLSPQVAERLGLKEPLGALIQQVTDGGPAEKAKLQAYDVIRKIGGKDVNSMRDLFIAVGNMSPGTSTKVEFIRDGKNRSANIKVGAFPDEMNVARRSGRPSRPRSGGSQRGQASQKVGLALAELNAKSRREFRVPNSIQGVLIVDVFSGSVAEQAGLQPGDVIKEIDQKPVTKVAQAERIISRAKKGVLLRVQSGDSTVILSLDFE